MVAGRWDGDSNSPEKIFILPLVSILILSYSMRQDLVEKLVRYSIKKQELETLLGSLGFVKKPGKGSHVKWIKHGMPPIVVASHDKEVKDYLIRQVLKVFRVGGIL